MEPQKVQPKRRLERQAEDDEARDVEEFFAVVKRLQRLKKKSSCDHQKNVRPASRNSLWNMGFELRDFDRERKTEKIPEKRVMRQDEAAVCPLPHNRNDKNNTDDAEVDKEQKRALKAVLPFDLNLDAAFAQADRGHEFL